MTKRNYVILFLLALIFTAPGLSAYLFYRNPQWLLAATINKGELLKPAPLFSEIVDDKPKWRLIFWYPKNCEAVCLQSVDKLARVRLALGRHLFEVDEWLVLVEGQQKLSAIMHVLHEKDIHVLPLSKRFVEGFPILSAKPKLFIANPKGYLVLAYEENTSPQDIYHDIKQLLKKSG